MIQRLLFSKPKIYILEYKAQYCKYSFNEQNAQEGLNFNF